MENRQLRLKPGPGLSDYGRRRIFVCCCAGSWHGATRARTTGQRTGRRAESGSFPTHWSRADADPKRAGADGSCPGNRRRCNPGFSGRFGQSQSVVGTVSISASEVTSAFVLPGIVTRLRQAHPGVTIEVIATNSLSDLLCREAGIAIRSVQPTDPDLIARKLKSGTAELVAAKSYLDRIGYPNCSAALSKAEFAGFDDTEPPPTKVEGFSVLERLRRNAKLSSD